MNEHLEFAKITLLALSDEELAYIEQALPNIRRVVRMYDDRLTSLGLEDLDSETMIQAVLEEMGSDLDELLGRGSPR